MTDWYTTCKTFSDNYQEATNSFPDTCNLQTAKSVKDIVELSQRVNTLKARTDNLDYAQTDATTVTNDGQTLKSAMKDFCCAIESRNDLQQRYIDAKKDYDIAKQRVDTVRYPPAQVSYLGTVVPFGRPLRSDSVPILLATTLVFVILGLGLLLNLGNIQLAYVGPRAYGPGFFQQLVDSYRQTSWTVLLITIAASSAAAIGIYYAIKKKDSE